jgi:flap endonuclease-1
LSELTDEEGNQTGHLVGLFYRTIQFLEHGVKPCWVFDGKPPTLKSSELEKRKERKEKAEEDKKEALAQGDMELARKMAGRTIRVDEKMKNDAMKMLEFMGVPVIQAPCEAEAQCAELCKNDKVFATGTEDMDALTFGTKYLLRGFNSKKEPMMQICLDTVLKGFDMNMDEFIDLCIICGCDYSSTIQGIGPVKAFKFMAECKNIEAVIERVISDNKKK